MKPSALTASLWVCGCANTIAGTVGDAGDATRADVARDVAPSSNLEFEVVLGRRPQGERRAGVAVRAEASSGAAVEAVTDGMGRARLSVDPGLTYTVTLAEPEYVVRSLFGVRAPLQTTVRLPRQVELSPRDATTRVVAVSVLGRDPRRAVVLDGASGSTLTRADDVSLAVADWPGAPTSFWLSALELDEGSRLTRGGVSRDVPRAAPGRVTVALDRPVERDVLIAEFSFAGRLTPFTVRRSIEGAALRFKATELGDNGVVVGASSLELPQPSGQSRWVIDHFSGDLLPEIYFASVASDQLTATVVSRPPFAGLTLAFPSVGALETRAIPAGTFAFRALIAPWSRARFAVESADGTARWEGFTLDATPREEWRVPAMPAGVSVSSVFGRGRLRGRACVARDAPTQRVLPWAEARIAMEHWSLLYVCENGVEAAAP